MPRAPKSTSAPDAKYPPGYFSELIRQHNWPPRFEPQLGLVDGRTGSLGSARASQSRAEAIARGDGWGRGHVEGMRSPDRGLPGWIGATK